MIYADSYSAYRPFEMHEIGSCECKKLLTQARVRYQIECLLNITIYYSYKRVFIKRRSQLRKYQNGKIKIKKSSIRGGKCNAEVKIDRNGEFFQKNG